VVAGNKSCNECARQEANRRDYRHSFASTNTCPQTVWKLSGGWIRRTAVEYPGTYRRSDTGAQQAADQEVAQTVSVLQEFHAANVLPRNGLSAGCVLVDNRGFRETHERSGMFPGIRLDDLNPLPRMQGAQICPGCLVALCPRSTRDCKDANQEQGFSHERILSSKIPECSFALEGTLWNTDAGSNLGLLLCESKPSALMQPQGPG